MDAGDYVNSPAHGCRKTAERRVNCNPGESKMFWLVGVSFGLLCIVQAVLNVSLRLTSAGLPNSHNSLLHKNYSSGNLTMMSDEQIREQINEEVSRLSRDLFVENYELIYENQNLQWEIQQLLNENRMIQANNSGLIAENRALKERITDILRINPIDRRDRIRPSGNRMEGIDVELMDQDPLRRWLQKNKQIGTGSK